MIREEAREGGEKLSALQLAQKARGLYAVCNVSSKSDSSLSNNIQCENVQNLHVAGPEVNIKGQ